MENKEQAEILKSRLVYTRFFYWADNSQYKHPKHCIRWLQYFMFLTSYDVTVLSKSFKINQFGPGMR